MCCHHHQKDVFILLLSFPMSVRSCWNTRCGCHICTRCSFSRGRLLCQVTMECTGASDGLGFSHIVKLLRLPHYTTDFLSQEDISLEHGVNLGQVVPQGGLAMAVLPGHIAKCNIMLQGCNPMASVGTGMVSSSRSVTTLLAVRLG